jgi:hypothetical protein
MPLLFGWRDGERKHACRSSDGPVAVIPVAVMYAVELNSRPSFEGMGISYPPVGMS